MRWNACITLEELTVGDVPCNSSKLSFLGGGILEAFYRHLNIFLIHFYWLLLLGFVWDSLLYFVHFVEIRGSTFIVVQRTSSKMMQDLNVGNLGTDWKKIYNFQWQLKCVLWVSFSTIFFQGFGKIFYGRLV